MPEKESTLAIVIRTVDRATAGIRAVQQRINAIGTAFTVVTAPARLVAERVGALGREAGIPRLAESFKGVGSAVGNLGGKLLGVVGIAGAASAGLVHLVGQFDELGDKAEALGVGVDALAQLRFAAERSGASAEQLDAGLATLSKGLGQARADTGRLAAFLTKVSPVLLRQVKATKSNEEAFLLLANAFRKVTDPAKRAALAQGAFGDAALAPLLARGATGINELRQRYVELAGSQESAVTSAGEVDDSMIELKASADGVKAALVSGLSPALTVIVQQLTEWLVGHRDEIRQWITDIGKKLPGAVESLVSAVSGALSFINTFVSAIGGWRVAALALVAVILGPLISSIVAFGVTLLTTPVGWITAGIAAIAAGAYLLIDNWDAVTEFFSDLWDKIIAAFGVAIDIIKAYFLNFTPVGLIINHWEGIVGFFSGLWDRITSIFTGAWDRIKSIVDRVAGAVDKVKGALSFVNPFGDNFLSSDRAFASDQIASAAGAVRPSEARVKVDFANAPRGTRASADPQSTADIDLSVGYQLGFAP